MGAHQQGGQALLRGGRARLARLVGGLLLRQAAAEAVQPQALLRLRLRMRE